MDVKAKQYVGIYLKWDYVCHNMRLSMDGYVAQALLELEHVNPNLNPNPNRYHFNYSIDTQRTDTGWYRLHIDQESLQDKNDDPTYKGHQ